MTKKKEVFHRHKSFHEDAEIHHHKQADKHLHEYAKRLAHKQKLPPGIKVLIAYAVVVLVFYFIYFLFGLTKPISVFFGILLTGSTALFVDLLSVILLIALIIGLIRRDYWTFWLALIWFSYGVLNSLVSIFMLKTEFLVLKELMLLSAVSVLVLNGIIVWYVYSEKEYFKTKHLNKETKTKDKLFVYIISSVLVISVLLTITFGVNFYRTTIQTTNKIIQEFNERGASPFICEERSELEKDICYVALTIATKSDDASLCDNIQSDFYKLTCYRALS